MILKRYSILIISFKLLCYSVLTFLFSTPALSQELYSKTFTTKDGLPSSYIFSTYEDKLGYLWIGTPSGLSRFDGKYFADYGYSDGLPDQRTDVMMMDSRLHLWVGTRGGIGQLVGNRFLTYPSSDSGHISYVFGFVETKKGKLWALTDVGVYQFDINRWLKINLYPGYESHPCRGIIETNDGMYINYGNILVFKKKDGSFGVPGEYNNQGFYYNQLSQSANQIFISTSDGLYSIKNEQLHQLPGTLGRSKGLYYYFIDSKKRYWIASEKNGLQFTTENDSNNLTTFYRRPGVNLISGINEDKHGNLWVADYNGLVRITEKGYKVYDLPPLRGKGILRNIFLQGTGPMLINDGSTDLITFENGVFGKIKLHLKEGTLIPKNELIIDGYAVDDKNHYWYVSRGLSLIMQDGQYIYKQDKQLAHLGKEVFDVLFDNYRKKLIIAIGTQKFPYWNTDNVYSPFPVANNIDVRGNIVRLHQCTNGNILFATDRGMLYSINKQNECKRQLNEFELNGSFRKFYNDPDGDLWIVYYGRGLRRYAWQNDSLVLKEQIDRTNGLPNDNVVDMYFDNLNNIWILMNAGVMAISKNDNLESDKSSYKISTFFNAVDLNIENAYDYKFLKTRDGNIWLGMSKQLICFYPAKINYTAPAPGIQIENIKLDLRQTDWSLHTDSLPGIFGLPVDLKLNHNKNTLAFYYKAVFSSGTEDSRFSYLLQGLDTSWSPPSSSDFVSFVNLPAGKYTFKVKSRLPNTGWSDPAVFIFEIKKAFWETWWFRLLVILAASALIVSVFKYRLKQVRTKAELKSQLHELESKALKAQMNPHFIFNAMNSIQSLIINNRTDEAGNYISKFAKLMRHVLENSDAPLVTIDKELYSIQLYVVLEKLRMNVDVDYMEEIDPKLVTDQEKIPSLILQPFVENALWHGLSKKEGYKKLSIKLKTEGDWVICEISDNGVGRAKSLDHYDQLPEGHLSKATGITLQRLISFNKTPGVQPIETIDLKDDAGNATGTSVLVRIKREKRFIE